MWKNVLVLVSLCLLFEDVNAQTTKNRYYKALMMKTFLTWDVRKYRVMAPFLSTEDQVLIFVPDFREENCL